MAKKFAVTISAILMLLTVLGGVPALAAWTLGTIRLKPSSASVGDMVTASGSFAPDAWVAVKAVDASGDIVLFDEAPPTLSACRRPTSL